MNEETRDAVRQWRAKAESDWSAVEILSDSVNYPADIVCFHCQQHVEKLLKALLTLHEVEVPRTHDLRRLVELAQSHAPELTPLADKADELTPHGVQSRYPDDWREVPEEEMREVVNLAQKFRRVLLPRFPT